MPTISSPAKFTGRTHIGPLILDFRDGVAQVDDAALNDGVRRYLTEQGYGIDADPTSPDQTVARADPREHTGSTQTNQLRDAAVDPKPQDFLPPVNAGAENPHGDKVVSPGIHAVEGPKPIHPGPVGRGGTGDEPTVVHDTDAQGGNESALAQAVLVDQQDVKAATQAAAANADQVNADQPGAAGPFDPSRHNVADVNSYLAGADVTPEEKQRVLDAEKNGKARAGILTGPAASQ